MILQTPFEAALHLESNGAAIVRCEFRTRARASTAHPRDAVLREASSQLRAYFARRLRRFDLPLDLHGTRLQVAVWSLVAQLETGELISYGEVARAIGSPGAHRGVAAAMSRSPYDLLIPAHRVVGADGKIKGAPPKSMRRLLLAFEGITLNG